MSFESGITGATSGTQPTTTQEATSVTTTGEIAAGGEGQGQPEGVEQEEEGTR